MSFVRSVGRRGPGPDTASIPAALFIVLLVVAGTATSEAFASTFNASNVLIQVTPLLLVATGQTIVVAAGAIDLSIGSIVSLGSVVFASLAMPLGLAPAVAIAVGACIVAGSVNGLLVARGLDPFLATLGTLSVVQGVAFTILDVPGGAVPDEFGALAGSFLDGPVPVALPLALAIVVLAGVFLQRSAIGLDVLSTGSNAVVARLCGVRVGRSQIVAYALAGLTAGLGGLFLSARTQAGDPLAGATFTLDSIAAVVLGGSALTGGRATILGSALGAVALGLLSNVLNFAHVSTFYQVTVKGALVISAVVAPYLIVRLVAGLRTGRETRSILRVGGPPDAA